MDNRTVIQQGLDYIEDNLQAEITAAELAEMAHISLFHYYRLFQQATGLPVMQYILRRRLLHGVYAIREGSSKTDAALRFGFDTYAGFYKAFCREFGYPSTPLLSVLFGNTEILPHEGKENISGFAVFTAGTHNRCSKPLPEYPPDRREPVPAPSDTPVQAVPRTHGP